MFRARQTDAEQNRPHYADPITCPVLAIGAQAYLGDAVSEQLAQVARDVRGVVIPASGHNIALENPAALARASHQGPGPRCRCGRLTAPRRRWRRRSGGLGGPGRRWRPVGGVVDDVQARAGGVALGLVHGEIRVVQ